MTGLSLIFRTLEPDTTARIFACRRPRLFRRLQQFKLGTAGGKGVETTVEMRECLRGVFVADLPQPKKEPVCSASQLHNVAASYLRPATSRIVRAKKKFNMCHHSFPLPTGVFFNGSRRLQENQVQAGISYKFDLTPPPAPIVAKY
jgi:hypothetical protein